MEWRQIEIDRLGDIVALLVYEPAFWAIHDALLFDHDTGEIDRIPSFGH
jgi:hypothetical protein